MQQIGEVMHERNLDDPLGCIFFPHSNSIYTSTKHTINKTIEIQNKTIFLLKSEENK